MWSHFSSIRILLMCGAWLSATDRFLAKTGHCDSPNITTASPPVEQVQARFRPLNDNEKKQAKENLDAVWAGYRSDIATAEIEYLALVFTLKSRQLTCDEFRKELHEIPLVADENLTRVLVEKFCPEKLAGTDKEDAAVLKAVGDWRTFRHQGNERRCLSPVFEHVMLDDLHLLVDHPNRDVKAFRRGACQYWCETMDWFRTIPNQALVAGSTLSQDDESQYQLEYFGPSTEKSAAQHASWLTLDRADALPREWRMLAPQTGKLLRMELFRDLTLYPGDVLCPAVRMKVNVENDKVTTVRMSVIRQARFNMKFEDDAFLLTAPANWSWFDLQLEKQAGGKWKQPVENVAEFFRGRTSSPDHQLTTQAKSSISGGWRSSLLIINGVILIALGIVLWRRSL